MLLNYPIILERIQFGYIKCALNWTKVTFSIWL
jgi:hypothetical protein